MSQLKSLKKPSLALLCFKSRPQAASQEPPDSASRQQQAKLSRQPRATAHKTRVPTIMLYTCYDYHSNRNACCLIFIKDKGIINVYENPEYNYAHLLFVMTEEKMKNEYEVLYKLYTISTMLTENANQLSKDTRGYGIHKRTIWKNLRICKDYDCENTYMSEYPAMSYKLSTDTNIRNNMQFIEDIIMISDDLIDDEFIAEFVNNESNCIEKELCDLEKELNIMKTIAQYMNRIIPENFPDDLKNTILADVYVF